MRSVHVNEASRQQLAALLDLRPDEVEALVRARPFAALGELRRALPFRVARGVRAFELPKLDINAASEEELARKAGIPAAAARAVVAARPFYFVSELRGIPELDAAAFDALAAVFDVPELAYRDKLTGRRVELAPDASEVVVSFRETEAAARAPGPAALGLREGARPGPRASHRLFKVPESESAPQILADLKRAPDVEKVTPAFRDPSANRRYMDPELCAVQFADGVPEARQAEIIAAAGFEIAERHRTPGLFTLRLLDGAREPARLTRAIEGLNRQREVKFAEPNFIGFDDLEGGAAGASGASSASTRGGGAAAAWNLALLRAPDAWSSGEGSPDVIIAVIDSGVDTAHPALKDGILPRRDDDDWNFASDGTPVPDDEVGHGTFIAGILVGNGAESVHGVCRGCRLLPLKVPLSGETASYARRRDAILYALSRVPAGKRLVISLSWKTSGDVGLIRDAIATAVERGAVVVCSAGNWPDGADQPHYPSDYPSVISVGAVGPDGGRGRYSFYGKEVDFGAPGGSGSNDPAENITSAAVGGGARSDFGTSFATPHVAGVAALILSQDLTLAPAEVRAIMAAAAAPARDAGLGAGLIDCCAAVRAAAARAGRPQPAQPVQPAQPTRPAQPDAGPVAPRPAPERGERHGGVLAALNESDADELAARFGIPRMTARLLVAHRPIRDVQQIRGTLGLPDEIYAQIAARAAAGREPAGGLQSSSAGG
ncbi:S8 family serine peptidase [Sorangium sp. So ce1153]|uniref:S8 family serine peptidase n=1 Tax=Sorangium sp. So ce1153 TaxID=3133333 RepID=UPI003F6013A2